MCCPITQRIPAKDVILYNAESLNNTLAENHYKQNLRTLEIVPSIRRYGEQRRLTSFVPFRKLLGRAGHFGDRYAFVGSNKADIDCRLQAMVANLSALRGYGFARLPWSHRRLIFLSRIVSASRATDAVGTDAQLLRKWKVLPARAEIAIRRVKWWQAMTEHNHAYLPTMVALW